MVRIPANKILSGRKHESGYTLVELLVVMLIMAILFGMIVTVWFAITRGSAFGSNSAQQQAFARDAVSRMAAQIRDAQAPASLDTAFSRASANEVAFYTTYNTDNAHDPTTEPALTRFVLRSGAVYREDAVDGVFDNGDDQSQLLVKNVVNDDYHRAVFTYWAYDNMTGELYASTDSTRPSILPADIVNISITVLVDLNPGKSPQYVTIETTVQPRNLLHI